MTDEPRPVSSQSAQPEDTRIARENNLDATDFDEPCDELPMLTLVEIRDSHDDVTEKVLCPEWGGYVYVRNPSGEERNAFERESQRRMGGKGTWEDRVRDLKERLALWFACNEDRSPFFDRSTPHKAQETLAWLRTKNAAPVNRIGDCALRLGGWTEEDVEDLVGNSESAPS
jgi:hypothetical protein